MQWNNDLPDTWDEAPTSPPIVDSPPLELISVSGGVVLRPSIEPEEGTVGSHSILSDHTVEDHYTANEREL